MIVCAITVIDHFGLAKGFEAIDRSTVKMVGKKISDVGLEVSCSFTKHFSEWISQNRAGVIDAKSKSKILFGSVAPHFCFCRR
jgi:hypothetical protein